MMLSAPHLALPLAQFINGTAQSGSGFSSRRLFDEQTGMIVRVLNGRRLRHEFHDDPVQEFFHQLKGDMNLRIVDRGRFYDVPICEGEVFMLPAHVRHAPLRADPNSVGLVIDGQRATDDVDGYEWFCPNCASLLLRVEVKEIDAARQLPGLIDTFYADDSARSCRTCGTRHPDRT
jgi:3-hydroxyanthranilate 3,4-dioxygenase